MSGRTWLSLLVVSCAVASWASSTAADDEIEFTIRPASEYIDEDALTQIIGGTRADPAEWPATFILDRKCTSTALGRSVILTAAHCVRDGATGLVEYGSHRSRVTCHHHPDYPSIVSADFALCFNHQPLPVDASEHLTTDATLVAEGRSVRLQGFGCNEKGGTDKGFGVLYEGDAKVTVEAMAPDYHTETNSGAAVCYGDSGGAAFAFLNPPAKTRRVIVGINSQGDISQKSWVSTTTMPGFVSWVREEVGRRNLKVCGLDPDAQGCRPL